MMSTTKDGKGRSRRRKAIIAATCVASVAGAVFAVSSAQAQRLPGPDDYAVPSLSERATSSDVLPEYLDSVAENMEEGTLRKLEQEANGNVYWAGLDLEGNLCLVVEMPGSDWAAGTSCASPELFAQNGIGLRVATPAGVTETYLVPEKAEVPAKLTQLGVGLFAQDPYADEATRTSQARKSDAGGFSLVQFDAPFTLDEPSPEG